MNEYLSKSTIDNCVTHPTPHLHILTSSLTYPRNNPFHHVCHEIGKISTAAPVWLWIKIECQRDWKNAKLSSNQTGHHSLSLLDHNDGQFFRAMEWLMFFLGHRCCQWFFNGFDKVGPSPLNVFWGV